VETRVRTAVKADLNALVALENESFQSDRLSRRSYRALLARASASILVVDGGSSLVGSAVLLFNRANSIARLYSIAVAPSMRGRGVARSLLRAAERAALEHECAVMRLEVRVDNKAACELYESEGFALVERLAGYYQDGTDAVRLERSLWAETRMRPQLKYYAQTLEFTCGPAALMMAMAALSPGFQPDRRTEIRLWREATTVFMTSGHGGCGPFGLALSAHARGFGVIVYAPAGGPLLVGGVRDPDKKQVIALVEEDFIDELSRTDVEIRRGAFSSQTLIAHLRQGDVPVVLISLYRLHGEKGPHWVTLTGYDGHVFRLLDPMSPPQAGRPAEISIARKEFEQMLRYGREREAAAVVLLRAAHKVM
jgi:ribosomal protein S18 acetylase RimI-like enzyme